MKATEYSKQIIETNIKLGFTIEQITNDFNEAMRRNLHYQMNLLNRTQELLDTEHGFLEMKRLCTK